MLNGTARVFKFHNESIASMKSNNLLFTARCEQKLVEFFQKGRPVWYLDSSKINDNLFLFLNSTP